MIVCKICKKEYKSYMGLSTHIRKTHNITSKEYYDKYIKEINEGICECGNKIKFIGLSTGYKNFCSKKCSANSESTRKKFKETCIKKYNVENPNQNKLVRDKIKQTNIEKYGFDSPIKNKNIKEKIKQTNLKKYGVENVLQDKSIRDKIKETNIEKCGFDNPFKSEEIKEKIKKTNLEKYGTFYPTKNKNIKEKRKLTFIERYGVDNPLKNKEIIEKKKETNLKKYGFQNPMKNKYISNKVKITNLKKSVSILYKELKYLNLELLDDEYLGYQINHKWKCLKCDYIFNQSYDDIKNKQYKCPKCYPRNQGYSKGEKELLEFIKSIEQSEVIENSRDIISPYEIDIYIPSKNIAIEFDGLYYHSEQYLNNKKYHLNKTELCESKNIQLIHIFEDEWIYKQDIVKSRIKQLLKINNSKRIHARKCEIREINAKVKNKFLNKFHIQGEDRSNIKLGAYCNNELVSIMTFSHGSISRKKYNSDIWELSRFCSNSNYRIPGIASKLLSYFKKNYNWKEIFSYADRRWSNGNVYKKIGFNLDSITKPNYWYIKNLNRVHRFSLRKKYEEPKEVPEWVLRQSEGYFRIWDCGHLKFKTIT